MTKKRFINEFIKIKKRIEKSRDDLRELIAEAEDILETNERAADALQESADNLSELL